MLSKSQISFINSLKQKKYREEHRLFIAEGAKIVPELMQSAIVVKQVYATSDFLRNNVIPATVERFEIKENELERISVLTKANEVLAVCETPNYVLNAEDLKGKLTLLLDDIKDPGNLGTIIRIADWFGIENIICSSETVDAFNPKVVQATMGSIARIKVHYVDLVAFLQQQTTTNKQPVYGALLEGKNIYSEKLSSEGLIVIGNESRGISEDVQKLITDKISIPSFSHYKQGSGEAESLNAAIATSIICSEFRRRK
ncbi:MAG: RNA methyltransferase [Bacteroidetes bacterium]|nr:RNA methyltransferase [Bacteroidota bacterium]